MTSVAPPPTTPDGDARAVFAKRLRTQAFECDHLGSALWADLMQRAAADVEDGGPVLTVLAGHERDPGPSAISLRLFGAIHRIALQRRAPELAAHLPSTGGDGDADAAWAAVLDVVVRHVDEVRAALDQVPQTNEVGRSAALMPGFLHIAAETGLPLRLLEVGASAGLNLLWDFYRYECGDRVIGDPSSPLVFDVSWFVDGTASLADPPGPVQVVSRAGCDRSPVDPTTDDGRTTLMSYIWPDQLPRFARIQSALEVAASVPAPIEQADAIEWVTRTLVEPPPEPGVATVLFHSIFIQYLTAEARTQLEEAVRVAGRRATPDAPLAWLRLEPGRRIIETKVTIWPGGEERLIATSGAHGASVSVLGTAR